MTLNVLVLESERCAADAAIGELESAGHNVLRCHEPGAAAFPCKALGDKPHCPLRSGVVDVAITVRPHPRSQPAPQEDGVSCALESHVPLVVAGSKLMNPFNGFATEVLDRTYDVVGACERAARAPLRRHGEATAAALAGVLEVHGVTGVSPTTEVVRLHGRLHATVRGAGALDHTVKSVASVRIIGALREIDPDAQGIDVAFDD
jgi:hypothetical protein